MYGGAGNDSVFADDKVDYSYGGTGDDQVTIYFDLGGAAYGGAGTDTLVMNYIGSSLNTAGLNYDVSVTLRGPGAGATAGPDGMTLSGFEILHITTYSGDDTVQGGNQNDEINVYTGANMVRAMGGDDHVFFMAGQTNTMDGGTGQDTLSITAWEDLDGLTLTVNGTSATDDVGSVLTGFEQWLVDGSFFADHVQLGNGRDWMRGRAGADVAQGMGGHDRLDGGSGADSLDGGNGRDVLRGGQDIDTLTGGRGADTFHFGRLFSTGDAITDFVSGVDHIEIGARIVGLAMPAGIVDDSHFHLNAALGIEGQFVYRMTVDTHQGALIWDANGMTDGGEILIAVLDGVPTLLAADLSMLTLA